MLNHPNCRNSTSPLSRQAPSLQLEREQPRMLPKPRSKSQPQFVMTSIVGPTKSEITRTVSKAKALATAAEAMMLFLKDPTIRSPDDVDGKTLRSAASLVFQMKEVVAKIEDFHSYIYNQFQKPELKDSPDRETLLRDVTNTLLESGADESLKKLTAQITEVELVLMGYGQPLSTFQPSNQPELQHSLRTGNRGLQEENAKHLRAQYEESQRRLAFEMKDLQYREPAAAIFINSPLPPFEQSAVRTDTAPAVESFEPFDDNRVVAQTTFPQKEYVQEIPILRSANQTNYANIEPRTAETPNATNRFDMNNVMNAFPSISRNQRIGTHIHERDESIRSRASRSTQDRIPSRSVSSYVRRYERGESSESEDEAIHPVPSRTAAIRGIRSQSLEPVPRKSGLPIEVRLNLLKKFDGTSDFDLFQTIFTNFVLDDDELSPEAKRAVLMNHITGPATTCVSHAKDSTTAIALTFVALNKVYGKVNSKHNLIRKLEKLPFHQTDPEAMRLDAASLANVLQQLKDRGVPADDHMIKWAIACKLPENMLKSLAKYTVKIGEALTHDLILDRISRDIEAMAMEQTYVGQDNTRDNELTDSHTTVNFTNANSSRQRTSTQSNESNPRKNERKLVYNPAQFPSEYVDPVTKSKLEGYYTPGTKGVNLKIIHRTFPLSEKERRPCNVCQGDHNEIRCTLKSNEFREMCKKKGLCPICARKHDITVCVYPYSCGYCNGLHHLGGCPRKEFYRDKKNYPKGAKPVATFFRANKANQSK